jgi:inner membrane protease ATP23
MLSEFWAAVTGKEPDPETQHNVCKGFVNEMYKLDPEIIFMVQQLKNRNCGFKKKELKCEPCTDNVTGGFSPENGIRLCENNVNKSMLRETILHEMIHYYDDCVYQMGDWSDPYIHACSEIRAAHISGDCRWWNEFRRGKRDFSGHLQECVRRRAILSMQNNPNCKKAPEHYVDSVFDKCFKNTEPFKNVFW